MAKIVTNAVFHSASNREARQIEIEVVAGQLFIRVGKSLASMPYEKMIKLIEKAAENTTPVVKLVQGESIVPDDILLGKAPSGLSDSE